ncbi:MAG TPA: NHLP bacteriocin export ABC transporter permease/ATPase subunit [Chloroflexota bacterium]|nr:NHLP bacteriocin export ABC transporter permease/ATPase subunit [Chloroflexota bacterium]
MAASDHRVADDPLLRACQLVGAAQGIAFRGPIETGSGPAGDPVEAIARASGARVRQVALPRRWWRQDAGPLLGFLADSDEPVALLTDRRGRYGIVRPNSGERVVLTPETAASVKPTAYQFYRPFPRRALSARDLLLFGLRDSRRDLAATLLFGLASGALGILLPIAFANLVGTVIPLGARGQLVQLIMVLIVAGFAAMLFDLARGLARLRIEARLDNTIQAAIWDRLLDLPAGFLRTYPAGDLANRALGITQIRQTLTNTVVTAVLGAVFSMFSLGLLFYYDVQLALAACGIILAIGAITLVVSRGLLPFERRLCDQQGGLDATVPQLLAGIPKLRVAGAESRAFARWADDYQSLRQTFYRLGELTNRLSVVDAAIPILAIAAIIGLVAARARPMPVGTLLGFYAAFAELLTAVLRLSVAVTSALPLVPVYERMTPILTTLPEAARGRREPGPLGGALEIRHASFRYHPDGPLVLDDVSFQCHPGELVAIVGPSGSGKSTIFRLLLGFERPERGVVTFDGVDLADFDVRAVRRQIGVVLQHDQLIPGDILTNIVGASRLTLADAWEAARLAGLDDEIRRLPMEMHTVVGEGGSTFSAGQRQRLMIARAVVTRPRILLFDEATSALDSRAQALVSRGLRQLAATRIVIAQRLSTIVDADRIYLLRDGKIAQIGTYAKLSQHPGPFAEFVQRQREW